MNTVRFCEILCAVSVAWTAANILAAGPSELSKNPGTAWPATDELGRELPTGAEVGPPVPNRFVGMFYFLWHNQADIGSSGKPGPRDVSRILASDPRALSKPNSPLWGTMGEVHYWGEPLFGYYRSTDPWVLRRHAHLLADAGIDTLIFDTTNAVTYTDVYLKLCEVFAAIRSEGGSTPQITFMVNTAALETATTLYNDFYAKGLYPDLWFRWQGKPLLICDPAVASDELRAFFTLRRAHWPFTMENTSLAWHWEATFPQPFGYVDDPRKREQVSVSVAQNLRAVDGQVTDMSQLDARGRGFHNGRPDSSPEAISSGLNFNEQWRRALDAKPPFVLVTGWNEWWATRFERPGRPLVFVDQYNQEYSRDIEPMRGGHSDNYYYQLVKNVRRFKGAPAQPPSPANHTIDIAGNAAQWQAIATTFQDHIGETIPRDFDGVQGLHYTNKTGRNDIVETKVCRDATQVYFWVRTREPLTPSTDANWMWLLIDRDQNNSTGWRGFDVIVNRTGGAVELNQGGWNWQEIAKVNHRVQGDQLQLALPIEVFEAGADAPLKSFDFKWIDNLQHIDDSPNLYLSGDTAPDARFRYRCTFE